MTACAPFVNALLLVELFPQYNAVSVYRWINGGSLPAPDLVVGHVKLWSVETIQEWARESGKDLDGKVLARIVSAQ